MSTFALASANLCGASGGEDTANSIEIGSRIGVTDHLVSALLDEVGMNLVESMPRGSFLRGHLNGEEQAVFPSTTSVALTSLATCQWPAGHAIIGWWTHIEQIGSPAVILQYISKADYSDLGHMGVDSLSGSAFPVPSAMAQFLRDTLIVGPAGIGDSTYSRNFCGGQRIYDVNPWTRVWPTQFGVSKMLQRLLSHICTFLKWTIWATFTG